jgi:hypothetical protein
MSSGTVALVFCGLKPTKAAVAPLPELSASTWTTTV